MSELDGRDPRASDADPVPRFNVRCDESVPRDVVDAVRRATEDRRDLSYDADVPTVIVTASHPGPRTIAVCRRMDMRYLQLAPTTPTIVVGEGAATLIVDLGTLLAAPQQGPRFERALARTRRWEHAQYEAGISFLLAVARTLAEARWAQAAIRTLAEAGQHQVAHERRQSLFRLGLAPDDDLPTARWLVAMAFAGVASDLGDVKQELSMRNEACSPAADDPPRLTVAKTWARAVSAARRGETRTAYEELGGSGTLPSVFENSLTATERARFRAEKSMLALDLGLIEQARSLLERAEREQGRENDEDATITLFGAKLRLLLAERSNAEAMTLARKVRDWLGERSSANADELLGFTWHAEAVGAYRMGDYDIARDAATVAGDVARKASDAGATVAAHLVLARAEVKAGRIDAASAALRKAKRAAKSVHAYDADVRAVEQELREAFVR